MTREPGNGAGAEAPGHEAPAQGGVARVLNHLLFHKSLLGEASDPGRLNAYIEMVEARQEGAHLMIANPFDRAIAIAFELAVEKHLDPWAIDLVQFTELYLDHVRRTGEIDLITAGRLIFLAWSVLKLQSDEALLRAEASRAPPEPEADGLGWDDIAGASWLTDDAGYAFTQAVLQRREPPIDEKVRRRGDRKVTLYELVEAFEQARAEAELRLVLDAKRREARQLWARASQEGVRGAAHKEDLEAEIREVWERIARLNGQPIPLRRLHAPEREDLVKTLVSVLFLARADRVALWQENFPWGAIYVRNQGHGPPPPLPEARAEEAEAPGPARHASARRAKRPKPRLPAGLPPKAELEVAAAVATRLAAAIGKEAGNDA